MLPINNYAAAPRLEAAKEQSSSKNSNEQIENGKEKNNVNRSVSVMSIFSEVTAKTQQTQKILSSVPPSLDDGNDERALVRQQLHRTLNGLENSGAKLNESQKQVLLAAFSAQAPSSGISAHAQPRATISDAEIWAMVSKKISEIGDSYLGVYENVVATYTNFYQTFSDLLSKMGGWLLPGKDGNTVKLDVTSLKNELEKLINQYSNPSKNTILFPAQTNNTVKGATREEAQQWIDELKLPAASLKQVGASFVVIVDLKPLQTMLADVRNLGGAGGDGKLEMDNAKYQAWQSGFKAQEENLKTTLQTLTQKYSNSNSLYDNLVKILSSTISSNLETAKSFLQG